MTSSRRCTTPLDPRLSRELILLPVAVITWRNEGIPYIRHHASMFKTYRSKTVLNKINQIHINFVFELRIL